MFEFVCVNDKGWTMRDQVTIDTFILEVVNLLRRTKVWLPMDTVTELDRALCSPCSIKWLEA